MYELVDPPIKTIALAALVILVTSIAIALFIDKKESIEIIKKQAIENNCARYNPTTGEFEWIKK